MNGETSLDIVWEPPTQLSSLDCWDYSIELDCLRGPEDLHLAAELGKTLLERNKELENCIKLHQCTIDDQAQEIEYMKKQTAALREVNDSRIKIYEQLEISIQDLERANHRLALENANDKKQIKSQCLTIDTLEARVDELQKKLDELNGRYESLMREQQTTKSQLSDPTPATNVRTTDSRDGSTHNTAVSPRRSSPDEDVKIQQLASAMVNDEDVTKLLQQLQESRFQRAREQKKVAELKEQLDAVLLEHTQMEEQLNLWKTKAQDMKNLQDEINTLEEVRQGHLCGRCLRGTDSRAQDELSVMLDQEEDDEISLAESLAESVRDADTTLQELGQKRELSEEENYNSYRVLVEKYEALLKIQQNSASRRKQQCSNGGVGAGPGLSLQEELQMSGEYNHFNSGQSEAESSLHYNGLHQENGRSVSSAGQHRATKKPFAGTPTDFSEAETSSSGFSDETSNKSTQTDSRPGSLLCSIADGEDCKFSIYDDSSNFESRFQKTPEHRVIFSEIFRVLKRAAEAKDVGTELPLLVVDSATVDQQLTPRAEQLGAGYHRGSPFNNCAAEEQEEEEELEQEKEEEEEEEEAPSDSCTDDSRSIASLAVSSVVSEPVFRVHTPVLSRKHHHDSSGPTAVIHSTPQAHQTTQNTPDTRCTTRRLQLNESQQSKQQPGNNNRRQPLEYLSLQVRKKGSAKKSSRRLSSHAVDITSSSSSPHAGGSTPDVIPTPNPKIVQLKGGSSRRRFRPFTASDGAQVWNGNTAHFYPSKSPRGRHQQQSSFSRDNNFPNGGQANSKSSTEYRPSAASEEVAKLRMLEMSYAEVLRMPNKSKTHGSSSAAARQHKHHR